MTLTTELNRATRLSHRPTNSRGAGALQAVIPHNSEIGKPNMHERHPPF